jgi:hypothetical protein
MFCQRQFWVASMGGMAAVLMSVSVAGAQTVPPTGSPAASLRKPPVPSTIPLGSGTLDMGAGFAFQYELKWDTAKGVLKSKGRITWGVSILGQKATVDLVVSETDGRIVNGNTLEIAKTWKGKSGLRVDTLIHLTPAKDGSVGWSVKADGYNSHFPKLKHVTHNKSGKIHPPKHPWVK